MDVILDVIVKKKNNEYVNYRILYEGSVEWYVCIL